MKTGISLLLGALCVVTSALAGVQNVQQNVATKEVQSDLYFPSGKTLKIEAGATLLVDPAATVTGIASAWGTIGGNIALQSDLQSALGSKVNTSTTVNGHALTGNVAVSAADVGLGSADNTSDAAKPISTATAAALAAKADASRLGNATLTGTGTLAVGDGSVSGTNTGDQNTFTSVAVPGQTTVTAGSTAQALTIAAGSGVALATDNTTKTLTITSTATGTGNVTNSSTLTNTNLVIATGNTTIATIAPYWDAGNGTLVVPGDVRATGTFSFGNVTGIVPSANGGAGTVNGIIKANGSGATSAAVAGTDYVAPAAAGGVMGSDGTALSLGTGLTITSGTISSTGGTGNATYTPGELKLVPTGYPAPIGFYSPGTNGIPAYSTGDVNWSAYVYLNPPVQNPTFSPSAGAYPINTVITASSATTGTTTNITNSGTASRTNGSPGNYTLSGNVTLSALAYKNGSADSSAVSAAYTIDPIITLGNASINAAGTVLTLTMSENAFVGSGGSDGFVTTLSGGATVLTLGNVTGPTLTYNISGRTVYSGETGTLAYTQPGNGIVDSAGQALPSFPAFTIYNGSTASAPPAYEFYEKFEGSVSDSLGVVGYSNSGWTSSDALNNPRYATSPAPLEGSYSYLSHTTGYIRHDFVTGGGDTVHLRIRVNVASFPGGSTLKRLVTIESSVPAVVSAVSAYSTSSFMLENVGGSPSSYTQSGYSTGTTYYIWYDYTKAGGSNGANAMAKVYISTTSTKPGTPTLQYGSTSGSTTAGAGVRFSILGGDVGAIVDDVIADGTTAIGSGS